MKNHSPEWVVDLQIFTQKEGMLAAVGHDLRFEVHGIPATEGPSGTFEVALNPVKIDLACAQKNHQDNPSALSEGDRKKIIQAFRDDVLEVKRFKTIQLKVPGFNPLEKSQKLKGELTIKGETRTVTISFNLKSEDLWAFHFDVDQEKFGIEPFSAAFGTLKVKSMVRIEGQVTRKN